MRVGTAHPDRPLWCTRLAALVVAVSLLQGCSDGGGDGASPSTAKDTTTSGTDAAQTSDEVQRMPDGLAEFVAKGTAPSDCEYLDDAPVRITDPRARWFVSNRTANAVDGYVTSEETAWIVHSPSPVPSEGAQAKSVLHIDDGDGPIEVTTDRTIISITRADDGGLYGVAVGDDGLKVVTIAADGTTAPVAELPEIVLAGSLLVAGDAFYLLDLTGYVEATGQGAEQGVAVLVKISADGTVERIGAPSTGAYAGQVDGVKLTKGTADGVLVEDRSGEMVAAGAFPGRYVGAQAWMILPYSMAEAVLVVDGRIAGCARRYGTTEAGVYQSIYGLGH